MKGAAAAIFCLALLGGCTTVDAAPAAPPPAASPPAASPEVPSGMQFLYGSGEAAALSVQAFNALVDAMRAEVARPVHESAVLAPGATLASPAMVPCRGPLAAVFDADETVILNLGLEYNDATNPGAASDSSRLGRWQQEGADKVAPVPGAAEALQALRDMGITVIFNTNRDNVNAAQTEAAINGAGLGPARHLETLWLRGDVDGKSGKDGRRWAISERYCVVAMGGDQLGDFSDQFTGAPGIRRSATMAPGIAGLFGRRWFILPNPVYGSGLRGGIDDIFPADKRWTDKGASQ